jgi:UDP-glucose:(heptosyl)LPS alpha-1,3-glucosyltransferase
VKNPIVLITESLDRSRGGAERYLADLSEYWLQAGHPVRAYVRRPSQSGRASGLQIEVLRTGRRPGLLREWEFARRMRQCLAGTRSVVLSTLALPVAQITHYLAPAGLYRVAFEAERTSFEPGLRRLLYGCANRLNLRRQWLTIQQERLLRRAPPPRVLTFSSALRKQILARFPASAASLTALPLGVSLSWFRPGEHPRSDRPGGRLVLLFVGHNFRLKGLHCLLRALHAATQRGLEAEVWVTSSGPTPAFERIADRLGIGTRVRFLGAVTDAELGELYRCADTLVHPTFADHCSLAVLEALASGLPVITTSLDGAAELMEAGRHGFVVQDPRDMEALTHALLQLQDRQRLAAMRAAVVDLRPRLDFGEHARRVLAWLTAESP